MLSGNQKERFLLPALLSSACLIICTLNTFSYCEQAFLVHPENCPGSVWYLLCLWFPGLKEQEDNKDRWLTINSLPRLLSKGETPMCMCVCVGGGFHPPHHCAGESCVILLLFKSTSIRCQRQSQISPETTADLQTCRVPVGGREALSLMAQHAQHPPGLSSRDRRPPSLWGTQKHQGMVLPPLPELASLHSK